MRYRKYDMFIRVLCLWLLVDNLLRMLVLKPESWLCYVDSAMWIAMMFGHAYFLSERMAVVIDDWIPYMLLTIVLTMVVFFYRGLELFPVIGVFN